MIKNIFVKKVNPNIPCATINFLNTHEPDQSFAQRFKRGTPLSCLRDVVLFWLFRFVGCAHQAVLHAGDNRHIYEANAAKHIPCENPGT